MAANSSGEEKSSAPSRGVTPARIAAIAALAVAVIVLAIVFFGGGGGHKYTLVFQNAGQLVPDNQVLIGGSPVGSVESIELSDDNLAEVHVEVEQELHEGTTAVIRATSLSGVANHYVSISPGPNSNPALDDGAELGLASTTTPVDIDQFFNTFPPSVRKGLSNFIKGNAAIYAGQGEAANDSYKYFGTGAEPDRRLRQRTERRPAPARTLHRQLQQAHDHGRRARRAALQRDLQRQHRLRRDRQPERRPRPDPAAAAAGDAPGQHDLRQPPRRARRPRPAGRTRRSRRPRNLAPFLAELRPVSPKLVPFTRNLRLTVAPARARRNDAGRPAGDAADGAASWPRSAFPHSEDAIAAFQPNLNFARAYTPDLFNALGKLGAGRRLLRRQRPLRAGRHLGPEPLRLRRRRRSNRSPRREQFDAFGSSAPVHRRCPGGATQPAADGSNPFVDPPWRRQRQLLRMQPGRRAPRTMTRRLILAGSAGRRGRRGRPARLRRRRLAATATWSARSSTTAPSWSPASRSGSPAPTSARSNRSTSRCRAKRSPTATASRSRSRARRSS